MFYSDNEARQLVIEAGHKLLENKLIARTWGNISARISADEFVITPSGRAYNDLEPSDLVVVKVSDCSYEGDIKPSSEKGVHAAAYGLREDVKFIIHTHQYYASAVAAECRDVSFAPCAEYALPGTGKLKKNVAEKIAAYPGSKSFLMARHGTLIVAGSMDEAFALAEELEDKCRELVEARVPSHDVTGEVAFDASAVRCSVLPCVTVVRDPYILECCKTGLKIGAYVDDFAQIVGPDMICVDANPVIAQRALLGYNSGPGVSGPGSRGRGMGAIGTGLAGLRGKVPMTGALHQMGGMHPALNSLIGRNAVLVRGVGAVCAGKTQDDADAAAMIVSKNCAAACYVRHEKPLRAIDARLQRYTYLTSYSKRIYK